jgi:hypothetical protein
MNSIIQVLAWPRDSSSLQITTLRDFKQASSHWVQAVTSSDSIEYRWFVSERDLSERIVWRLLLVRTQLSSIETRDTFAETGNVWAVAFSRRPDINQFQRRATSLQAADRGHNLLGKPAHTGQDLVVWYQATRVEPADKLIHLALRVHLLDLGYASRRRPIERHRLELFPGDGFDPLADLP